MQALGSVSRLGGQPFAGKRHSNARWTKRQAPIRASANEGDEPKQGGLRGLLASLTPKTGTVRLAGGGKPAAGSGTQQKGGAQQKGGTQQKASAQKPKSGTQIFGKAAQKAGGSPGFFSAFAGGGGSGRKDPNTVFVAGSTGRLGIRIVRELAAAGFKVRAGVRSQEKAEGFGERLDSLSDSVGPLSAQDAARIKVVFCDLEDPESIAPAIGNASRVVCAVGAAEAEFKDLSAPKRIDYEGTERLVQAAAAAGVAQFVLVTSLGTGKFGLPAGVLNLFGGVLTWKRKAEEALERSGVPYLIVRPGGMERPKDRHKDTHNVRLQGRDTLFGGTISRLQVAELIAAAVASPEVAQNKAVEVVAETTAPRVDYADLLATERTEIGQEERLQALQAERETAEQLEGATEELEAAKGRLVEVRERLAELQAKAAEARSAAKTAQQEAAPALQAARRVEAQLAKLRAEAEQKSLLATAAKTVAAEAQRAQREARLLGRDDIAAIRRSVLEPVKAEAASGKAPGAPKAAAAAAAAKPAAAPARGFFGGWPAKAPVQEAEPAEEEEEEVAGAGAGGLLASFFGPGPKAKRAPAAPAAPAPEEEAEGEEEKEAAKAPQRSPAAGFAGLFGFAGLVQPPAPTPAPAAARPSPQAAEQVAAPEAQQAKQAAAAEAQQAKQAAAAAAAAATEQKKKRAAAAASAAQQAKQVDAAAAAAAAEELAARRAAAAEAAAETEARMLRALEEKKDQREAEVAAKRKAAEQAALMAAEKQAAEQAAKKPAGSAKTAPAAAAAAPAAAGDNAAEARQWIADWRSKSEQPPSSPSPLEGIFSIFQAPKAEPRAPAAAGGAGHSAAAGGDRDVPPNVLEAREWIATWRAKS